MKYFALAMGALAVASTPVQAQGYKGKVDITPYCSNPSSLSTLIAQMASSSNRGALYVPAGKTCQLQATLRLPAMLPLIGDGSTVSTIQMCAPQAQDDAIVVEPPTGGDNRGHVIRGLRILPCASDLTTKFGVHVKLAPGAWYAYFDWSDLAIGKFAKQGINLDNAVNNGDGIFNGRIRSTSVENGIYGVNVGDSVVFEGLNVNLSSPNCTGTPYAVTLSQQPDGAILTTLRGGSIISECGFLNLNGPGYRIDGVSMQHVGNRAWAVSADPDKVRADAIRVLGDDFYITGSTISVGNGVPGGKSFAALRVNGRKPKIINTTFSAPAGECAVAAKNTSDVELLGNTYGSASSGVCAY